MFKEELLECYNTKLFHMDCFEPHLKKKSVDEKIAHLFTVWYFFHWLKRREHVAVYKSVLHEIIKSVSWRNYRLENW